MDEQTNSKKDLRKKILKIIKRTIIILAVVGITLSTIPSIEFDNAYNQYKSTLPSIQSEETNKEYVARLYKDAIESNKKLNQNDKNKLIEIFTNLVIDEIGDYFTKDNLVTLMAVASTQSVKELTLIEKKFGWYTGFYNKYLNQIVINTSIEEVEDTLLAHEQLHAVLRNSFNQRAYALNEIMTKNSVKGDDSYSYLNKYFDILSFTIGKEKLYKFYLDGDIDGLKEELSKFIPPEEVNKLIVSSDDLVFSKFYTSFLYNIGINPDSNLFDKPLKEQDEAETTSETILTKIYEKRFDCELENSSLGKVLFGYYTPSIEGLTLIKNKIGYYEPICKLEYLNEREVKVTVDFITSNIDPKTSDFYVISEEYIIDIEEFASLNMQDLIEDAKAKHASDLVQRHLDKRYTLS